MVTHYQPGRLGRNSDQPTAITNVLVATSRSPHRTGDIPLGIPTGLPTCSARSRHGPWALYPNGAAVVVVWPGGTLAGPPVQVAGELDRLGGDETDDLDRLDRAAVRAMQQFLTDHDGQDGTRWPATTRARTWSSPATGTGSAARPTSPATTTCHPVGQVRRHAPYTHPSRCPIPARRRHQHRHRPPDRNRSTCNPARVASDQDHRADGSLPSFLQAGSTQNPRTEPTT